MVDDSPPWVPLWTVHVTLASALLVVPSYLVGSRHISSVMAVSAVGVTYILYKWGQYRDPPSNNKDEKRKEMEAEAEVGGATAAT